MTRDERAAAVAMIGALPLFQGCTRREIERLAASVSPVDFHAGDRLCVSGAPSDAAYVLAEGRAVVTVGNVTVDEVAPADVVGERGPITNRRRAATVTAATRIHAYAIPRTEIQDLMDANPAAAAAMRDELLRRYG